MDHVDWTPKGGDGASATEEADHSRQVNDAIETFRVVAQALANDEHELARVTWEGYEDRVAHLANHYALFTQAGIICAATAVRAYCGDADPTGPPTGQVEVIAAARDQTTGEFVDLPEADVAATAIGLACGWEWDKLNELMVSKVEHGVVDREFLQTMSAVLMTVYVGVGGLGSADWTR